VRHRPGVCAARSPAWAFGPKKRRPVGRVPGIPAYPLPQRGWSVSERSWKEGPAVGPEYRPFSFALPRSFGTNWLLAFRGAAPGADVAPPTRAPACFPRRSVHVSISSRVAPLSATAPLQKRPDRLPPPVSQAFLARTIMKGWAGTKAYLSSGNVLLQTRFFLLPCSPARLPPALGLRSVVASDDVASAVRPLTTGRVPGRRTRA